MLSAWVVLLKCTTVEGYSSQSVFQTFKTIVKNFSRVFNLNLMKNSAKLRFLIFKQFEGILRQFLLFERLLSIQSFLTAFISKTNQTRDWSENMRWNTPNNQLNESRLSRHNFLKFQSKRKASTNLKPQLTF